MPIKVTNATVPNTILFNGEPYIAVSVIVSNAGVSALPDGRKVLKAGTPLTGDLKDRTTPFAKASISGEVPNTVSNAVAMLLHDVDVTDGDANATALIQGVVNFEKISTLSEDEHEAALKHIIFVK